MKTRLTLVKGLDLLLLLSTIADQPSTFAQGTAFTYQGRLNDGANPANGIYDLRFAIYDLNSGGAQQGNLVTNAATGVSNGLFTVALDFGNQFPGANRWLEIGVRSNGGGAFSVLSPRHQIRATPYAITAGNVTGPVAAANITGTLPAAQLPSSVVTNGASGVNFTGTFSGNGAGITGVNVSTLRMNQAPVAAWGNNFYGQTTIPVGLSNVVAIAAGGYHGLALRQQNVPATLALLNGNNVFHGTISAPGFTGNGDGLTNLDASKISSGTLADARLSANVALRAGGNSFFDNQSKSGSLDFGAQTRQMINLWDAEYAIGVQSDTLYQRSNTRFSWFRGGTHNDSENNAGGGTVLMTLNSSGLTVNGTFVSSSDRNVKENFTPVNAQEVLEKVAALPLSRWNYKEDKSQAHLGPMAQDFFAAFGVGPDDKHITTVDADGVALAAIQGLNQKVDSENAGLRSENAELKRELFEIKQLLLKLSAKKD